MLTFCLQKELTTNINKTISAAHRDVTNTNTNPPGVQNDVGNINTELEPNVTSAIPGESPPLPPRIFFGRDELVEKVVDLTEKLHPIALIGAGGIGKTSVALTVLHHDRIKQRFGDDRRFIRCDQFPTSRAHFLHRLSNVIGAGIENPEDLTPLRPFLSSKEMLIVLDNTEFILDPQGTDNQEIHAVVEELCRFDNICICITSRTPATLSDCRRLDVPTLSIDAARETFYRIYNSSNQSNRTGSRFHLFSFYPTSTSVTRLINGILELLDFHPLSITLFATVADQNKWDTNRLTKEQKRLRASGLQTEHDKRLPAAIELSFTSPPLQELGPDARALLGVVAFFPQGVNGDNIDWLFPTIPNRAKAFDDFCTLSLTHRNDGFITMLAPLRDYFSPKDPKSSPLLCTTKEHYFTRMSASTDPGDPGFIDTRWITSEDLNVEHLLDVFTTIDADSDTVWNACAKFMECIVQHKSRPTILQPKIEALPDNHTSKPECLFQLSRLFGSIGNQEERKRLLTHALKLERERGDDRGVAQKLWCLSDINRDMGIHDEGIQQATEASEIYERFGDTVAQAGCLVDLAWLLDSDEELDAAEEAASRAISLVPEDGDQSLVFQSHRILGKIYQSQERTEEAIQHYEVALGIAPASGGGDQLFEVHSSLASLFLDEARFDDAQAHVERAKSLAVNNAHNLDLATQQQASISQAQNMIGGLMSGLQNLASMFETVGTGPQPQGQSEQQVFGELISGLLGAVGGPGIELQSQDRSEQQAFGELMSGLLGAVGGAGTGLQPQDWSEQQVFGELMSGLLGAVGGGDGVEGANIFEELEDSEDEGDFREFAQLLGSLNGTTSPG